MSDYTLKTHGLDQILKALKKPLPVARVGIYNDKNQRSEGKTKLTFSEVQKLTKPHKANAPTNAEIGAIHEYGSPARGIPPRSFLRAPIAAHLDKELKSAGAFDKEVLNKVIRDGSLEPWMKKIAVVAEKIVINAFNTGGYGAWPAWKNPNYSNNTDMILVDSTQLRDSIGSEVVVK